MEGFSFLEIISSLIIVVIIGYIFWNYINQHPAQKYHNRSWKPRTKKNNNQKL